MKLTLLTSKTCGPCFTLKNRLKAKNLEVNTRCFSDPSNHEFFKKHGVKSVPVLVVESDTAVAIITGMDDIIEEIEEYFKNEKNY